MLIPISQILDEIATTMADPVLLVQTGEEAEQQAEERSDAGTLDPERARLYRRIADRAKTLPED